MLLVLAASHPPFLSPHVCGIPVSFLQALHSWTSSMRLSCLSSKLQHKVTRIPKLDLPLLTVHLSFSPHSPLLFFNCWSNSVVLYKTAICVDTYPPDETPNSLRAGTAPYARLQPCQHPAWAWHTWDAMRVWPGDLPEGCRWCLAPQFPHHSSNAHHFLLELSESTLLYIHVFI